MHKFRYFFKVLAITALAFVVSCRSLHGDTQTKNFSDIVKYEDIGNGKYRVKCSNGKIEEHSLDAIRKSAADPSDQTVCRKSPLKLRCVQAEEWRTSPFILATLEEGVMTRWGTQEFFEQKKCEIVRAAAEKGENMCWTKEPTMTSFFAMHRFTDKDFLPIQPDVDFTDYQSCEQFYKGFRAVGTRQLQCWPSNPGLISLWVIWEMNPETRFVKIYERNTTRFDSEQECLNILFP